MATARLRLLLFPRDRMAAYRDFAAANDSARGNDDTAFVLFQVANNVIERSSTSTPPRQGFAPLRAAPSW
jgi:hypothetical protein